MGRRAVVHRAVVGDRPFTQLDRAVAGLADEVEIVFADHHVLSPDVLELYAADGTRVAFSGVDSFVPTNAEACAHNERHYALDPLALGDYLLVHRRKNGTGDPLNCIDLDCPWTTYEGDQAVTLTLAIR